MEEAQHATLRYCTGSTYLFNGPWSTSEWLYSHLRNSKKCDRSLPCHCTSKHPEPHLGSGSASIPLSLGHMATTLLGS